MYDFLLIDNSNYGPTLHRFRDTAMYMLKSSNLPTSVRFSTPLGAANDTRVILI